MSRARNTGRGDSSSSRSTPGPAMLGTLTAVALNLFFHHLPSRRRPRHGTAVAAVAAGAP
ncbi:hypothetical protein [Streptomyces sp. 16-176A]|uniref:hypothetical protein n=1 Tax=Streptomyces sp. 16-176A TaxID=2530458 RepID=UPI00345D41B9